MIQTLSPLVVVGELFLSHLLSVEDRGCPFIQSITLGHCKMNWFLRKKVPRQLFYFC